ncbi:DUF4961 domain-containing protein [Bacteroidales bacterium OttesenSCG-928-I14]|nr:DUF4961 domain-containing protein [Bacteroidales bacterium OttesenSCG-928-I14]
MKNRNIKNRKFYLSSSILTLSLALVLFGCVFLDSIDILQLQSDGSMAPISKANTEATFTLEGNITCQEDHNDVQFVVSFLAPKSWKVRENATVTYKTTLHTDTEEILTMTSIPLSSVPVNGGGRTWGEALMQEYGVGPNVLSDMEWITFQTDKKWSIQNGDKPSYTIYIKTNVGKLNIKAYLGFFVNHTDDGISTSSDHKKVKFSEEPFEVIEGEGLTIDFSTEHYSKVQPLASLQDDFVTFSFNGGIFENDLVACDEIYLEAKAYSVDENDNKTLIAEITEKSDKTILNKESVYSQTFSKTVWPTNFFNIPDGIEIGRIEFIFTNKDRSITITKSDDDFALEGIEITGEKEPFIFDFTCQ